MHQINVLLVTKWIDKCLKEKIQLDADKNEIKRNPINIIKALKDINIPSLLLNKSVNRPAGTFISPEEILFAVANAPI